jgi:hypothetical protein
MTRRVARVRRGEPKIRPMRTLISAALVCCTVVAPLAAQQSWTVGTAPGPGIDFTSFAAAVAAAADGDIVFLTAGTHSGSGVVTNKALRVVGAGAATTTLNGGPRFLQPPAPFQTVVERLKLIFPPQNIFSPFPSIGAAGGNRLVFCDAVLTTSADTSGFGIGMSSLGKVALYRCTLQKSFTHNGDLLMSGCTSVVTGGDLSGRPAAVTLLGGACIIERCSLSATVPGAVIFGGNLGGVAYAGVAVQSGATLQTFGDFSTTIAGTSAYTFTPGTWTTGPFGLLFTPGGPAVGVPAGVAIKASGGAVETYAGTTLTGGVSTSLGGTYVAQAGALPCLSVGPWTTTSDAVFNVSTASGALNAGDPYVVAVGAALGETALGADFVGTLALDGFITFLAVDFLSASGAASFSLSGAGYDPGFLYLPFFAQVANYHVTGGVGTWRLGQCQKFMLTP